MEQPRHVFEGGTPLSASEPWEVRGPVLSYSDTEQVRLAKASPLTSNLVFTEGVEVFVYRMETVAAKRIFRRYAATESDLISFRIIASQNRLCKGKSGRHGY